MKRNIPETGVYKWRTPDTCGCEFAWLPYDGLILGDYDYKHLPDYWEPCVDHRNFDGETAFKKAMERALLRNMAVSWLHSNQRSDVAIDLEVKFDGEQMVVQPQEKLSGQAHARLVKAVNDLVGADAVRVK